MDLCDTVFREIMVLFFISEVHDGSNLVLHSLIIIYYVRSLSRQFLQDINVKWLMHKFPDGLPKYPKIRPVNSTLIKYKGHNYLKLDDPMSMSDLSILIPEHLAYVIQVCDGTKDIVEMKNLMGQ